MIDWAPTLLIFSATYSADMQGQPLAKIIASDERLGGALFGVFGGHVNVTDGHMFICGPRSGA